MCIVLKIKTESVDLLLVSFITTADKVVFLKVSSKDQTSAGSVAKINLSAIDEEMLYNLYQLYATNKLTRFSISFLQDICTYCHLEIDSIPATRKAPYIGLINDLIKSFTCKEKQKISSQE